jgi:hypothetical protein
MRARQTFSTRSFNISAAVLAKLNSGTGLDRLRLHRGKPGWRNLLIYMDGTAATFATNKRHRETSPTPDRDEHSHPLRCVRCPTCSGRRGSAPSAVVAFKDKFKKLILTQTLGTTAAKSPDGSYGHPIALGDLMVINSCWATSRQASTTWMVRPLTIDHRYHSPVRRRRQQSRRRPTQVRHGGDVTAANVD